MFDYIKKSKDPWDLKKIGKNKKVVKLLKKEIGLAGKVIDIGGGFGFYADALREMGNAVTVLEMSEKMINEGKRLFPEIRFVKGDATKMPFPDKSFDAAVCMGTLMYIKHKNKCFSEVRRILCPGGSFFLYERNKNDIINNIIRIFKDTEKPADKSYKFLQKSDIKELADNHGFTVKKLKGTGKSFLVCVLIRG